MRKSLIIFNPTAGRFPARPFIRGLIRTLRNAGYHTEAVATQSGKHAIQLAKQAAGQVEVVFAIGGDGTVGQVASGLVDSETALGVLPAGTQNVWGRELNLPVFSWTYWGALNENVSLLIDSPVCKIDVGLCNNMPFLMWTGMGLDAMAVNVLEKRIRLEKFFAVPEYTAVTLWQASQWEGLRLCVWADEQKVEGQFILGVANNIRHYMGGLANLSPDAYVDDGVMDYWLFFGKSLLDALRHAYELSLGKHLESDAARRIRFRHLRVEADAPFMVQLDGDPAPIVQKVEIIVKPRALNVLMPRHALHLLQNYSSG